MLFLRKEMLAANHEKSASFLFGSEAFFTIVVFTTVVLHCKRLSSIMTLVCHSRFWDKQWSHILVRAFHCIIHCRYQTYWAFLIQVAEKFLGVHVIYCLDLRNRLSQVKHWLNYPLCAPFELPFLKSDISTVFFTESLKCSVPWYNKSNLSLDHCCISWSRRRETERGTCFMKSSGASRSLSLARTKSLIDQRNGSSSSRDS